MRFLIPVKEPKIRGLSLWDDLANDFIPSIDAEEDEKNVYIKAELAGLDKKDIKVEYKENILTISGEKKEEKSEKKEGYYYREISSGQFCRRLNVGNVDFAKAEAHMKNGILKITLPKAKTEEAHKLEIN